MTDTQPLVQNGVILEHERLPGEYLYVDRDARGRVRFQDPSRPGAWLEADGTAVLEVGKR